MNAEKQHCWFWPAVFGALRAALAADLPPGFVEEKVADGISGAPGIAVARDPETGQRTNQLMLWNGKKMFEPLLRDEELENLPRMAGCEEPSASNELRVRSYLAANCAMCHCPEGPSRGVFDARFETPLALQRLLRGEPIAGDLGSWARRLCSRASRTNRSSTNALSASIYIECLQPH